VRLVTHVGRCAALATLLVPMPSAATVGTIATMAGTGIPGLGGDGGPAATALLNHPRQLALDAAGNLFVAEVDNHRIRRIDAMGTIDTYAGTTAGFSGDGGPATAARFQRPVDVTVDGAGNVLVADLDNHRIRRVDAATGILTTIAGTTGGFSGDGGLAIDAQLFAPYAVAVDGTGTLYVGDLGNQRIRRVDGASGVITTIAGTGVAGFSGDGGPATAAALYQPIDLALDAGGNLFVADFSNHRIRRIDATTGVITTFAGSGTAGFAGDGDLASAASLNGPVGIAFDAGDHLFVAELESRRIRRVDATTGIITTVAGFGEQGISGDGIPAVVSALAGPFAAIPDGAGGLLIADRLGHVVRRATPIGPACVGGATATGHRLRASRLQTSLGDDGLSVKAVVAFDPPVPLDPLASGLRVVVTDAHRGAAHLDATLPAGAYASATQTGWRVNGAGTRWSWVGATADGIAAAAVSTYADRPGVVRVKVRGRHGRYGSMLVPLEATLVLNPSLAPSGPCAVAEWSAMPPQSPSCQLTPAGRSLRCR
jgi:DNA-binding beta-propeller fold protein YncE